MASIVRTAAAARATINFHATVTTTLDPVEHMRKPAASHTSALELELVSRLTTKSVSRA